VHHGVNPEYIDKNHAAIFIVWDRLFGTFQEEGVKPTYGITRPLRSWNPGWANLHYYAEMAAAMKRMSRWRDKLYLIVAKPGWLPRELGGYQAPPPVDADQPKFNPQPPGTLNGYLLAQFVLITLGLVAYMTYFDEIGLFYQVLFLGIIIVSTMIVGAIMEQKPWIRTAEIVRLVLVVLSLNSLYFTHYTPWFSVMLLASLGAFTVLATWFVLRTRIA
jgi:hypothetical protein